jgi:hypothetical protein
MAGKVADVGGIKLLEVLFSSTAKITSFAIQLFTDSNAAADSNTNATHTVASGGGYASGTLTNNATVSSVGGIPTATWGEVVFEFTGALDAGATIKGYQVLTGTTLLFEEVLTTPFTPAKNGDQLGITVAYAHGNGTPV